MPNITTKQNKTMQNKTMSSIIEQGSVKTKIADRIAEIEFGHPMSNSLPGMPGKILNKFAKEDRIAGEDKEAKVVSARSVRSKLLSLTRDGVAVERRVVVPFKFVALALVVSTAVALVAAAPAPPPIVVNPDFHFIDASIENGSPLHWDFEPDGSILISLQYDHERTSPNRASGHWHFRVEGRPGSTHTFVLQNFVNYWNGKPSNPVRGKPICVLSEDGRTWRAEAMEVIDGRLRLRVKLPASGVQYLAHVEPYRLSDLEKLLAEIRPNPLVQIEDIGRTVEGRPLEIVRVGRADAPHRVFLRARAHPWEPGGNWVVQGLIRALLADTPESRHARDTFCVYVMPMANKDGVARGRTRFNLRGRDLNRNWSVPAPADLAPENYALEQWLARATTEGRRPQLALDLHNDAEGLLHLSRPEGPGLAAYLENMKRLEALLRQHTWFREGSTGSQSRNPGTLGEGWLGRFGIPAAVLEFNAHWIAGKQKMPLGADWEEFGAGLMQVFSDYFTAPEGVGAR